MIQDKDCNSVYFSEYLQEMFPHLSKYLSDILLEYGYTPKYIPTTDNTLVGKRLSIWVRDYMSIQRNVNDFVLFDYRPNYLVEAKTYVNHIPDAKKVLDSLSIKALGLTTGNTQFPDGLNIDGGNVLRCGDYIVMTDKVFDENPKWKQQDLVNTLTDLFGKTIIFLPWDRREFCGHTDGILRYIGNGKVLLNTYGDPDHDVNDKFFMNRFKNRLETYFGEGNVEVLKFSEREKVSDYRWAYVNWLQLEKVLIIPKFGVPEDDEALQKIEEFMPEYKGKIKQVMMEKEYDENKKEKNLADLGGCLNCASWTIRE